VPDLPARIVAVHNALTAAAVPHAFGGALALAWCTERARGTIDIDINVLLPVTSYRAVIAALPDGVQVRKRDLTMLQRDGQARVWWQETPLDLFLNTTKLHDELAQRVRWEPFGEATLPFLSCLDLAVFKVFFNRTKDWADLEAMLSAGTLDVARVRATIAEYLGNDDERITRLDDLPGRG